MYGSRILSHIRAMMCARQATTILWLLFRHSAQPFPQNLKRYTPQPDPRTEAIASMPEALDLKTIIGFRI